MASPEPEVLWTPSAERIEAAAITRFARWVQETRGVEVTGSYDALWRRSVDDLEGFWAAIWEHFDVQAHAPYERVLGSRDMPGAQWFPGARLNYAEHAMGADAEQVAILGYSQTRDPIRLTFGELRDRVARARAALHRLGVRPGDRVAAYLPNIPEAAVAFLATASLGAIWSSCAPEFGARAVIDRFAQIEPTVLLAVAGYRYGGKDIDRRAEVAGIRAELPTVERVVHVPYGSAVLPDALDWNELLSDPSSPAFEAVPFDHPLCVLFSSGTTGKPKAIVHGHGGILLEHFKNHVLSWDLRAGDRML